MRPPPPEKIFWICPVRCRNTTQLLGTMKQLINSLELTEIPWQR